MKIGEKNVIYPRLQVIKIYRKNNANNQNISDGYSAAIAQMGFIHALAGFYSSKEKSNYRHIKYRQESI